MKTDTDGFNFKADKDYCRSYLETATVNGSYLVLPNKDESVKVLCWSTVKLADGRYIGVGRDLDGIVAFHIPVESD